MSKRHSYPVGFLFLLVFVILSLWQNIFPKANNGNNAVLEHVRSRSSSTMSDVQAVKAHNEETVLTQQKEPDLVETNMVPPTPPSISPVEQAEATNVTVDSALFPSLNETEHQPIEDKEPPTLEYTSPLVVHLTNGTRDCWLDPQTLHYLGFGIQGHAFSVDLICTQQRERVVFKLSTESLDKHNVTRVAKRFVSVDSNVIHSNELLYERLRQNSTDSVVKKFFAIHLGTVDLPHDFLNQVGHYVNQQETRQDGKIVTTESQAESPFLGTIAVLAQGASVSSFIQSKEIVLSLEQRRSLVRDYVEMHRFLVDRDVWHGDMSMRHLFYSPETNQTTLIDLDLHVFLDQIANTTIGSYNKFRRKRGPEKFRKFAEIEEITLVLNMIANICGHGNPFEDYVGTEFRPYLLKRWAALPRKEKKAKKVWKKELTKCGFERPMVWPVGTILNASHIEETYRALEEWVGLDVQVRF